MIAGVGGIDDAMTCIYAALSQERVLDLQAGQGEVSENESLQDAALAQEQAALKRQEADEAGSGRGFFSSIGHLFTDVAGDLAHGQLARAASDVGSDVHDAWDSPKFWGDIATALRDVAAVAGAVASAAAGLPGVGTVVTVAAGAVGAVAAGGAALANVRVTDFAAGAVGARADATAAKGAVDLLKTTAGWLIDDLKETDVSRGRAIDDARRAIETNDQTLATAASVTVRG